MTKRYGYNETIIEIYKKPQWVFDSKLNYLASEIMEILAIDDVDEMRLSQKKKEDSSELDILFFLRRDANKKRLFSLLRQPHSGMQYTSHTISQ
jgi:hypothetical protein